MVDNATWEILKEPCFAHLPMEYLRSWICSFTYKQKTICNFGNLLNFINKNIVTYFMFTQIIRHLSLRLLQVQNSMAKKEFRSRSTTNIANNLKTLKASYTHLKLKLFFHLAFLNLNGHSKPLSFFKKKLLPSWDLLYL